jgi:ABC-type sugar transport system ATPase subunit
MSGSEPLTILHPLTMQIPRSQFIAIVGPSGSGKSTLLGLIAGLDAPSSGSVLIDDVDITRLGEDELARLRGEKVGFVFQFFHLIPSLTAYENVAVPMEIAGVADARPRAEQLLAEVGLTGRAHHYPSQLSGGEQQRVALARALAVEPKVLLMDEPLSNLDARLREEVRDEIKNLSRKFGIAVLYVTHDQVEAMALADRVAVMSKGKVLQCAPPRQLYEAPSSREVCEFLGSTNLLDGVVSNGGQVETELGKIICSIPDPQMKNVSVAIRPEEILLSATSTGSENEFAAEMVSSTFLGELTVCDVLVNGKTLRFKTTQSAAPAQRFYVRLPADKLKLFARS